MPARRSRDRFARDQGAVVNVASQAALVSLPQQAAYSASKGAVAALTRSLAIDWAEHGVRVNAVAPGFTVTPMTEAFFENETFTRAATRRIPLGRLLRGRRDRRRDRLSRQSARQRDHRRRPARRRRLDSRGTCSALVTAPRAPLTEYETGRSELNPESPASSDEPFPRGLVDGVRNPWSWGVDERGVVAERHVFLDAGKVLAEEERRRQLSAGASASLLEDRSQVVVDSVR